MANSVNIQDHFTTQFDTTWRHLSQQKGGRLKGMIEEYSVRGKERTFNQIDKTAYRAITTRNGATVATPQVLRKRWLRPVPYDEVTHWDEWDESSLGETILPTSPTMQAHMFAYGRKCDAIALTAATGNAAEGETGSADITLASYTPPTGSGGATGDHVIANTGALDTEQVIEVHRLFNDSEAYEPDNPADQLCWAIGAQQQEDLLLDTEFKNSDYNAIKALVQGGLATWGGFEFVRVAPELLTYTAATDLRITVAWVKSGLALGIQGMQAKFSIRDDLNETLQLRSKFRGGAVRLEEAKVVSIGCDESV